MSETLIAAHRGGSHIWPENTLLAFRNAAKLPVAYVEFDVHRTKDGVLVVHHDATIDRMTDGKGAIADKTLAELRSRVVIGSGGETIPMLEQVIEVFKPTGVDLRLELKGGPNGEPYEGIEKEVGELLASTGMLTRTLVTSFAVPILTRFRDALPAASKARGLMWLVAPMVLRVIGQHGVFLVAHNAGVRELGFNATDLDARLVAAARLENLIPHGWAAHTAEAARKMFELGVASFTTDRPDIAIAVREQLQKS